MICNNWIYKINKKYYNPIKIIDKWEKLPLSEQKICKKKDGSLFIKSVKHTRYANDRVQQNNQWSDKCYPFKTLAAKYDLNQIKSMVIKKEIVLIPCGKCECCLNAKRNTLVNRVKAQQKKSKYSYFITLTMSNEQIPLLVPEEQRVEMLNLEKDNKTLSYLSTLSKTDARNIIRNIKKKLETYYKEKIKVHFLLCGEYGSNTKRAHYHLLLMLDKPLPNLTKKRTNDNRYDCPLLESKQYGLFDLQLADSKTSASKYITKYLTKGSSKSNTAKLNMFQEKQQQDYLNGKTTFPFLLKKPEHFDKQADGEKYAKILATLEETERLEKYQSFVDLNKNNPNVLVPALTYQKEFIKMSRGLGIDEYDFWLNYENRLLNNYYMKKLFSSMLKLFALNKRLIAIFSNQSKKCNKNALFSSQKVKNKELVLLKNYSVQNIQANASTELFTKLKSSLPAELSAWFSSYKQDISNTKSSKVINEVNDLFLMLYSVFFSFLAFREKKHNQYVMTDMFKPYISHKQKINYSENDIF